jgi:hypothetical protein
LSKPWTVDFNVEELGSSYRGDLDPEKMVWIQIQRCNILHSQGEEVLYGNAVMSLLINVPTDIRIEIESGDLLPLYYTKNKMWRPVLIDGDWGSADPDHPDMINVLGTLRYNPKFNNGQPKQISPVEKEEETWDYYALQRLIMEKLQERGLTWKKQRTEIFTGEEWDPAFDPIEEEDDEPEQSQTN